MSIPAILAPFLRTRRRPALLGVGLFVLSFGAIALSSASQTAVLVADNDLRHLWRTTYDILVRPAGARTEIEARHGIVESNHLSGLPGGIEIWQYEAIKQIPGVEVAAPIAMIGHIPQVVRGEQLATLEPAGGYLLEERFFLSDGVLGSTDPVWTRLTYFLNDPGSPLRFQPARASSSPLILNHLGPVAAHWGFPFLIAGIDPEQEAALIGLDKTVIEGTYLRSDSPLSERPWDLPGDGPEKLITIPAIINTKTYVQVRLEAQLFRIELPQGSSDVNSIIERGGSQYLAGLPRSPIAIEVMSSQDAYDKLVEVLRLSSASRGLALSHAWATVGRVHYREGTPPESFTGITLEVVPPGPIADGSMSSYRQGSDPTSAEAHFAVGLTIRVEGVFDIELIERPADPSRVPLETYFPPITALVYDERGRKLPARIEIGPTLNPAGYVQSPPLILTTLDAAAAIKGPGPISAIRVRVGGIADMTAEAQEKIEAVATEIARVTGLEVDVMVGSSPRPILVRVPGVGYVEEQWIQKSVNLVYARRIQEGHFVLLSALVVVSALFAFDLAWSQAEASRVTIALERALGWRRSTVLAQLIGVSALVAAIAGLLGLAAGWGTIRLVPLAPPPAEVLVWAPAVGIAVTALGSLIPATLAARSSPSAELHGQGTVSASPPAAISMGFWGYSVRNLLRRPFRTLLSATACALAAAILVLLTGILIERHGTLGGTLLGQFILVHIEVFHYAIGGMALVVAGLSVANALLSSALERRREIGVLRALGWRRRAVRLLLVREGSAVGLSGGSVGTILALAALLALGLDLTPTLAASGIIGTLIPALIGGMAAVYPAHVASRFPPAETLRYE